MPSPRSCLCMASAWLLSFVPERETKTFIYVKVMKSPTPASCPPLLSLCRLGLVQHCYHDCVIVIPATTGTCFHTRPEFRVRWPHGAPLQEAGLRFLIGLARGLVPSSLSRHLHQRFLLFPSPKEVQNIKVTRRIQPNNATQNFFF